MHADETLLHHVVCSYWIDKRLQHQILITLVVC
jgi:hypothetical protein